MPTATYGIIKELSRDGLARVLSGVGRCEGVRAGVARIDVFLDGAPMLALVYSPRDDLDGPSLTVQGASAVDVILGNPRDSVRHAAGLPFTVLGFSPTG